MRPRVSVVISMFNAAATVGETIESVRAQTLRQLEILVIDDGSTDSGPHLVREIAREEPRLRLISQENRGLAGARNRGIGESTGEFFHFLDADDWMNPRGLEHLLAAARETGASYGGYELTDENGRPIGREAPISAPIVGLDELLDYNRTATHCHLFRRDIIGADRFDERLRIVEDYDMWLRLALRGVRFKAVEQIVARYRLRPRSMSRQFASMSAGHESAVLKAFGTARELGWDLPHFRAASDDSPATAQIGGSVDLSEARLRRVIGGAALAQATMDALSDPSPGKSRAAGSYSLATRPARIDTESAAAAAATALIYGFPETSGPEGPRPDAWLDRRWLSALRQWWVRCADEGWMELDQIPPAFESLSRRILHPDAIADALLDKASAPASTKSARQIIVIGLDKHGRRLSRRAAARGLNVTALDDFSDRRELDLLRESEAADSAVAPSSRTRIRGMIRILDRADDVNAFVTAEPPESMFVIAPADKRSALAARALLDRNGRADERRILQWFNQRAELAADQFARMNSALAPARKAG